MYLIRLVVLKRFGFQSQKYGIPILKSLNFTLSVSEYVTTNVTVKPLGQRFCTKHITAVLWSLTCAAVKLRCFKTVTFLTVNHTGLMLYRGS